MKEIIQLNLTEKEAIILQSIVAVGMMVHLQIGDIEGEKYIMDYLIKEWPEESGSLAMKMTESVKVSMDLVMKR